MERTVPAHFADRVRQAREESGLSQAQLAERLGVTTRMVTYYEAGLKAPSLARLPLISRATRKPVDWFFAERRPRDPAQVPLFDEVPAGRPFEALQDAQEIVAVPARWVRGRAQVYCLRVRGRSMEPLIMDGDIVAVRSQPDAEHGEIVVATLEGGEFALKRLVKRSGHVLLESLNPDFPDLRDKLRINGRVIGLLRDL